MPQGAAGWGTEPRPARARHQARTGRDGEGSVVMRGIDGLGRDVRDGARSLARRPAFTTVAVVSLALGIGANTAIFSLVNAVILRDSPIERPEEVVNLYLH